MDEQIQSILNQAMTPQSSQPQQGGDDPIDSILQSAGVSAHTPQDVTNAEKYQDQPVDRGLCENFVEKMAGLPNMGGTAAEAWNNYIKAGRASADIRQANPGDLVYFDGDPGHVGIMVDRKGNFISADYDKVSLNNLSTWKQKPLGYVPMK